MKFDDFGPEKIVEVYDAKSGMHGVVVIDNTWLGPGKGGIRMTPTVSTEEVFRLARTMTWKNAMAGLPFGGAKSGIIADAKTLTREKKDEIVAAFGNALKIVCPELYVAGPDMNMAEHEMKVLANAVGTSKACTGKPKDMGGIPHELGSTGWGVIHSTLVAAPFAALDVTKATVAIEGYGNVGVFAARFLAEKGVKIVAVSDSGGVIYDENGLDVKKLEEVKTSQKTVTKYPDGKVLPTSEIISLPTDILITAAIPDLIKPEDIDKIKAKLIVEGSNIPMKEAVENKLAKKGILIVPDFVANAGGVISSYVEYIGGTEQQMFEMVEKKIVENTRTMLETAQKKKTTPRKAAMKIAKQRVLAVRK